MQLYYDYILFISVSNLAKTLIKMFYHSICSVLWIALLHIFSFLSLTKIKAQTLLHILQFFQIAYTQMQTVRQI